MLVLIQPYSKSCLSYWTEVEVVRSLSLGKKIRLPFILSPFTYSVQKDVSGFAITYSLCLLALAGNSTSWNYSKALVLVAKCLFHEIC